MKRLVYLAESAAQEVSLSRRRFLSTLGRGAAVAVGAVASLSAALAAPRSAIPPPPGQEPTGACFYTLNGIGHCQMLTESQCSTYLNSDWYDYANCPSTSVSRR